MEFSQGILLAFCGVGIFQSVFFSIYLFSFPKGNKFSSRIFSLLLIVLAIRLTKSIIYHFFNLDPVFMNVGYAAHAAIGPLLYLYIISYRNNLPHLNKLGLLHLIPSAVILLFSFYLKESHWIPVGYSILLYHMMVYFGLTWYYVIRNKLMENLDEIEKKWLMSMLIVITIFGCAYFSNFILGLTSYITGPFIYSIMIYYISYIGFRFYAQIFGLQIPLRKINLLPHHEVQLYLNKLQTVLDSTKPYLEPDLNLSKLARDIGLPAYRLSQMINEHFGQNFSDYINTYRIEEAKRKLVDPDEANKKVAAIAFEVGFNTLSAFNNSFKRFTNQTPSEYKKSLIADVKNPE